MARVLVIAVICAAAAEAAFVRPDARSQHTPAQSRTQQRAYDQVFQFFMQQANATIQQVHNFTQYPSNGICGSCFGWETSAYDSWTAGFFPGTLLKLYNYTTLVKPSGSSGWWWFAGLSWSAAIAQNRDNTGTHDVGFMVRPTFIQQYELTGNQTARDIAIETAHSLAMRFVPPVGCIRSWGAIGDPTCEVIIDNMMNLELLWWGAEVTGNRTLRDMAMSHSNRMIQDIYQPFNPGCVWHLLTYNSSTGDLLSRSSVPQGLGTDTVWSRGQAWATYGFTLAYRYTQNATFLQTAIASAECFMRLVAATSDDGIPPWDFNATGLLYSKDTSAAAVAVAGIIELSWYVADAGLRSQLRSWAQTTLNMLVELYLVNPTRNDAVLTNGTTTFPSTGISIVYGDYYLLEALLKWQGA